MLKQRVGESDKENHKGKMWRDLQGGRFLGVGAGGVRRTACSVHAVSSFDRNVKYRGEDSQSHQRKKERETKRRRKWRKRRVNLCKRRQEIRERKETEKIVRASTYILVDSAIAWLCGRLFSSFSLSLCDTATSALKLHISQ